MPISLHHSRHLTVSRFVAAAVLAGLTGLAARGADFLMTASGPFASASDFSDTFDGTAHGQLPTLLDSERLMGGSFRASYWFSAVTPLDDGSTVAVYDLSTTTARMSFDLLDEDGIVVHSGVQSLTPEIYVANNNGAQPFSVDQVLLFSLFEDVSDSSFPTPIYGPQDRFAGASLSFAGYVDNSINYLSDLAIPTDEGAYAPFMWKTFDVHLYAADGDINQVDPYQISESIIGYDITSLSIVAVPEAGTVSLFGSAMAYIALRRRAR